MPTTAAIREHNPLKDAFREISDIASNDDLRQMVGARLIRLATRFLETAHEAQLKKAAVAATDYSVAIEELSQPGMMAETRPADPLAGAYLRGFKMMENLLRAEGGQLTVAQVAGRLHISTQGVNQRRKRNRLAAIDVGRKGYLYPAWQFKAQGGTLEGLEAVLAELERNGVRAWDVLAFFLNKSYVLNRKSPLDALRGGEVEAALRAAKMHHQQGAA